jgi:hypothetical protein
MVTKLGDLTVHLHHSSQTKSLKVVKKQFSYYLCFIMEGIWIRIRFRTSD